MSRELDAKIGGLIFGLRVRRAGNFDRADNEQCDMPLGEPFTREHDPRDPEPNEPESRAAWTFTKRVPCYSTDPAAAWEVVDKMSSTTKEHWTIEVFSSGCVATFRYEGGRGLPWTPGEYVGEGVDMPEAVCLAALAAVTAKPD